MQSLAFILRELTNNILKHSSCDACSIDMSVNEKEIRLKVMDNGRVDIVIEGNGLKGIRQRVELLDGRCDIDKSGKGFRVTIAVPRNLDQASDD